jgi:hypothetical protein
MLETVPKPSIHVLDPIDRIAEVLFGLIMVLTVTSSLSIATGGHSNIRAMLIGALGCNLAWGIIDAGMYLMARLSERGRNILMMRTVRQATDDATAHRIIAGALPPLLASFLTPEQLEFLRCRDQASPGPRASWRRARSGANRERGEASAEIRPH